MSLLVFIMLVLIEIDQLVKAWAIAELKDLHTIPILKDVFHFTYVENRGAAFSLFSKFDSQWIFIILAAIITIVIFVSLYKQVFQTKMGQWSVIMIAAGATGNAIDRVVHGFVVDLFDFRLINFPVFNVADIFICAGGVLFVIYVMFQHKDTEIDIKEKVSQMEKTDDE